MLTQHVRTLTDNQNQQTSPTGLCGSRHQPTEVAELVIDQRWSIATFATQRDFGSTPGGLEPPTFSSVDFQAASRVARRLAGAGMNSERPSRTIDGREHRPHIAAGSSAGSLIERRMAPGDGSQTSEGPRARPVAKPPSAQSIHSTPGGTRTPNLLIRRSPSRVHRRPHSPK